MAVSPQSGSAEEVALIEGFLHGDREATRRITAWVVLVVHHRAWRLRRNEDLVQDVLIKLIGILTAGRFEGRSSLQTFVERVAKYTCLDAVRHERRIDFLDLEDIPEPLLVSDDDPGQELEVRESARLCYAVLERLPSPCRELLRRVLAEDTGYDQLADEHDVAVGTIKSRVARCRERANTLRQALVQTPQAWRG